LVFFNIGSFEIVPLSMSTTVSIWSHIEIITILVRFYGQVQIATFEAGVEIYLFIRTINIPYKVSFIVGVILQSQNILIIVVIWVNVVVFRVI